MCNNKNYNKKEDLGKGAVAELGVVVVDIFVGVWQILGRHARSDHRRLRGGICGSELDRIRIGSGQISNSPIDRTQFCSCLSGELDSRREYCFTARKHDVIRTERERVV